MQDATFFVQPLILEKLKSQRNELKHYWDTSGPVRHFFIDDFLPETIVDAAVRNMPDPALIRRLNSHRERKSVSFKPEEWGAVCRDVLFAFQDKEVLQLISEITSIHHLIGDPSFYAGGTSEMRRGDFLNPHLDNSAHPTIRGYRRLNALFYVSRDWKEEYGGNLELWSPDMKIRKEIFARFNRLVVMSTNRQSLHSVDQVQTTAQSRKCLSNYYYSAESPDGNVYSHITSYRGRPGQWFRDVVLRVEAKLGTWLVKVFPRNPNKS